MAAVVMFVVLAAACVNAAVVPLDDEVGPAFATWMIKFSKFYGSPEEHQRRQAINYANLGKC